MSFNHFLISNFTQHTSTKASSLSIQNRFRSLSIIYLCTFQIFVNVIFSIFSNFFTPLPCESATITLGIILGVSLMFLKKGKDHASAASILIGYHIALSICNFYGDASLGALLATNLMPSIGFLITSYSKLHTFNLTLCCFQVVTTIIKINSVFSGFQPDEQERQILSLQIIALTTFPTHWVHHFLTRRLETQLLQHVETNFEKTENISKELMQALSAKDTFVSCLSHEIRNPLNSLNGTVSYLLTTTKDSAALRMLKNARLSGNILLNLVNNLLDAAKLKSDKMELQNFETDPVEVITNVLTINTENLKKGNICAETVIYKDVPSLLWVDSNRLLQILMNLMSNAIKFTDEDGGIKVFMKWYNAETSVSVLEQSIEPNPFVNICKNKKRPTNGSVRILGTNQEQDNSIETDMPVNSFTEFDPNEVKERTNGFKYCKGINIKTFQQINSEFSEDLVPWTITRKEHLSSLSVQRNQLNNQRSLQPLNPDLKNGFLKVQISDNGCGVPEDVVPRLFTMFTQSHSVIANKHGGTGLGLWISKQLCQKMGGDIIMYSKENQGTTFVFYLPVSVGSMSEIPRQHVNSPKQMRVLVVDDYMFNRELHKLILEREGVQVTLASDGAEAVKEYTKHPDGYFTFIMMDVQMPVMDGFTAAKKIRDFEKEKQYKHIDIYFVSGEYYDEKEVLADLRARERISETSQMRCLKKPIDIQMVGKIVKKYLEVQQENS